MGYGTCRALLYNSKPVCTVGCYEQSTREAYMAAGVTAPEWRGRASAGLPIASLANELAAERDVCFLGLPHLRGFYQRLGFVQNGMIQTIYYRLEYKMIENSTIYAPTCWNWTEKLWNFVVNLSAMWATIRDYNQLKRCVPSPIAVSRPGNSGCPAGYGVWDDSRNKLEEVFARCMGAWRPPSCALSS